MKTATPLCLPHSNTGPIAVLLIASNWANCCMSPRFIHLYPEIFNLTLRNVSQRGGGRMLRVC